MNFFTHASNLPLINENRASLQGFVALCPTFFNYQILLFFRLRSTAFFLVKPPGIFTSTVTSPPRNG